MYTHLGVVERILGCAFQVVFSGRPGQVPPELPDSAGPVSRTSSVHRPAAVVSFPHRILGSTPSPVPWTLGLLLIGVERQGGSGVSTPDLLWGFLLLAMVWMV